MPELILALDQSSSTGWAVVSASDGNILTSGTAKFSGEHGKKLSSFYAWLANMIEEYHPIALAHEKPHFRGYAATMLGAGLVAIINMTGYQHNLPVLSVHTATLKKFATGKGKAVKADMTQVASDVIGSSLSARENNDEADAIHIARWAVEEYNKNAE